MPSKITDLTAASSVATSDLLEVTINPASVPASRKATVAQILANVTRYFEVPLFGGITYQTATTPGAIIAARAIDTSAWPSGSPTVRLVGTLQSSGSGVTSYLELWNTTRAEMVTSAQLTNSAASNKMSVGTLVSSTLTVGTSSGNIRSNSADEYELRLYQAGGGGADFAACLNASLRITY